MITTNNNKKAASTINQENDKVGHLVDQKLEGATEPMDRLNGETQVWRSN